MSNGVRLFEGQHGFGADSIENAQELSKALEAGYQTGPGRTGGSAMRVESLERSLKVVTYNANHIKLWKKIPKSPAYSTVEEYNELTDYGGTAFPFLNEGETPLSSDSSYIRRMQMVKFMGTTREITHQASLVHPAHGDLIALENQNGILWLLERIEQFLFTGDSSLAADGGAEQWDGLDALIDPTSVLDLEGNPLQEADIEEAANIVTEAFGHPTDIFLGTRTMSDVTKQSYPKQRLAMPSPTGSQLGFSVNTIATQSGVLEFMPDVFLKKRPSPPAAAASGNAPASPASIAAVETATGLGDFNKGAAAGDVVFAYAVTACNRFGESAPTFIGATVTLDQTDKDAGDVLRLTITNPATIGAFAPEYFRIYRTRTASSLAAVPSAVSSYSLIAQVPASSQAASGTTVTDDANLNLPFTSTAYLGEMSPSVLTFRQLMPMMKMDLAVFGPAFRWMILLYGTPMMFAKKKWIRLINVGELSAR